MTKASANALIILCAMLIAIGCAPPAETKDESSAKSETTKPTDPKAFASAQESSLDLKSKTVGDPPMPSALKPLEQKYKQSKAAYLKKPTDKKLKEEFIEATVKFGHETMVSEEYPARYKYKRTLQLYAEVLKLDPKNPVAKPETDLIVDIYKQMGRPVPK